MWFSIHDNVVDFRTPKLGAERGLQAAELAIMDIIQNYPPPYHIMLSGGVDSQAMLYAWQAFGKNFIPTSVVYNNGLNDHDLKTLKQFANRENIDINYIDFDLLNFYKTDYDSVAHEYECSSPQIATHIAMTKNLSGTVILSGSWLGRASFYYNKAQHALYLASLKRPLIPFFFIHTPELAYTYTLFLKDERMTLNRDQAYMKKVHEYHVAGFPVIGQGNKFTGFEAVKDYYDEHYKHTIPPFSRLKYVHKQSKRTFDLLLRYPYEDKFGDIDFKFLMNDV